MRRNVLRLVGAALCLPCLSLSLPFPAFSQAADYPNKPIRLVIPYPPGGGNDTLGRIVAQRLSTALGQQVFVDNKAGAGGNLGTEQVAHAKPDGYTLTLGFVANMAMTPHLGKLNYDPIKDFAPISMVAQGYQILVVNPSFPAKTVPELVTMAKAKPGTLNFASGGNGSPLHLVAELFKLSAGVDMMHIPYKGSTPAAAAVISGETQMVFGGVVSSLPFVKSGRLRALAVTSPTRIDAAPDVPTMVELGYKGVEASSWYGLFAPAGTPPAIIARLNREMVALGKNPEHREQLDKQGQEAVHSTPEELAAYVKSEFDKWGNVIKTAKIQAD
ncbi:MAG: Tripartite-type tricarboxylate transporter, receptor component TctC [Polaromonas sp.]|nr:Tripartite-type tricarboxylate transporter, receptor component TctC [Polaromonas sp.]